MAYAPLFSSHDRDRKTHIANSDTGESLCGIEKKNDHLFWNIGSDYYSVEEQFLIDNPEPRRNGCLSCRKAYLKIKSEQTHIFGPYSKKRYRCGLPFSQGKVANLLGPPPTCKECSQHLASGTQYNSPKNKMKVA